MKTIACVRRPYVVTVTFTRTLVWGVAIGVLRGHANSTAARGLPGTLPLAMVLLWTLQTAGIAAEGAVIVVDSAHQGSFFPEVRLRLQYATYTERQMPGLRCRRATGAVDEIVYGNYRTSGLARAFM